MKIQAKSSRRTIPPHPDVVRLVQDLLTVPKNELASFISKITQWIWPRSELHVWFTVLDRFDEIMEELINLYDAANLQIKPFSDEDKALLFQILRFERMLLDNSTNRKLFNSYDRLSTLVMSPDIDIAIEALSLILRPAHQYTLQMSLNIVLRVNHNHLEYLARSWPVLREHNTTYLKLLSPQEDISFPPEASDVHFQWYPPKAAGVDPGPHSVHLKALSSDSRSAIEILQEAIDSHAISVHDRFDLLCRIRVAKSLGKQDVATRSKLVSLRLLAIAVYCHTHTETSGQNARLLMESDIITSTAPLLSIDKGVTEAVQASAVHALDGICHHRFRAAEVLTAVNASVAHGLLMSLFRKTVSKLDDASVEPFAYAPLFDALQNFLDFLITHDVSYNMVVSAGLIEHLRKIVANRQPSRAIMVARTIPLLENALYGPSQSTSTVNQRNNNPFSIFMNDGGIQFLLERIKFEVDSDISEFASEAVVGGPPLGYGKVPTPKINVLKHLLRTIQRMLQSTGSAEVLRLLPEPEPAFISSLKSILDNRHLFGSTILAAATLVIATWVHNEPASLTIIQESKLPDSFYNVVEQGIEPMIEVIHGILNAMGALSLNQGGQTLLQNRLDVIPTIFSIFTSEVHTSSLQEKSNAALIGGDMDELVRHHPWLRPTIFKSIASVLERIETLAQEYQPKQNNEGHFDLIAVPVKPQVASTSDASAMETDQVASQSEESESAPPSVSAPFDLHEMPIYQFLNNFSKFLGGFFSHAQHCREIITDTDFLTRFDRILTLPCWPIEFPMARNLESVLLVNRRLMDAAPSVMLKHRVEGVKGLMASNSEFRQSRGSDNRIVQYVNVSETELLEARSTFTSMRKLLIHLILLNDVYSQTSSHSIHQPFRREPINMLEPLVEAPLFISQIGELFKASAWEILHLRALADSASKADSKGEPTPGENKEETAATTSQITESNVPAPEHPFAELIPRKRLVAPQDTKGKSIPVEERNHMNIKSVLHAFSNVLQSIFTGIAKALPMPRRLPPAESTKFRKDSKEVTKILADTLVDGLRSYHASDDAVVVMGFCALAISSTSCIGPESRHGQNMQTGLFLEFERSGGITAVVDVCTFCADLIDRFANVPEGTRTTRDKEVMAIALYFLRHPLIWFYHLASGKPLVESPQTLEILRFKTYEDFDPADTIVRLRLQLLPVFKRFWEAKWLVDTSESVRKAIIYGLLAILKGEHEDSTRLPSSHLSMPSHPAFVRRVPQPLSPAAIQQLTEMGFPETAVRSALTRARGDITVATELLLANAHLFDGTEDNTPAAVEGTSANAEAADASPETTSATTDGGAAEPNDQVDNETSQLVNPGLQETAEESEDSAPITESKRDYAKELAEAREELKASIVPNALRLADANPAFIDDIRDVFIGPTMNGNAKFLIEDIKRFSNGSNDVPEIPLQVRCRILALAYLKVGSKGLGLTKEDANDLLQSLLALLLAGPVPGSAAEPNIPKWLSSHMLLSDRILCSSEDIATATLPPDEEPLGNTELYVGPKFTESRRVLFDFCMRLACIPDLQKDDLLSLFGVLSFLTKEHELAIEFVQRDGLNLVLQYFKSHRQQEDVAAVCMGIFRHIMEDQPTIRDIMRQDLKRWGSVPRSRPGEGVPNFLRAMQHTALRDPDVFLSLTEEMCELVEAHPSVGGHRIRPKAVIPPSPPSSGEPSLVSPAVDQTDSEVTPQGGSEAQTSANVIHQLTAEMMQHYDPNSDQPGALPVTGVSNMPSSTTNSGMNTPAVVPEPGTNVTSVPEAPTTSLKDVPGYMSKDIEYSRFIQNVLTELLLCYETCKTAFLMYPRIKSGPTTSKDTTKVKSPALSFILQEAITAKGDLGDLSRRRSKMNPFQSMVVALCSDVSLTVDALSVSSSVAAVRKAVLDAITKTLKDTPNSSETTEQRYGRFIALGDLCQKLLTTNPHATTQKPQEESLFHIAKLMLEKGFVSSLSAVLAEVDLAHPMASLVTSSILSPLETLTKVSIKIGRVTEKADGPSTIPDRPADFSTDSEAESMVTDTEEALDPYSTSALGMYGGEAEAAFAEVEEPLDDEEEDDIEMDYAEDDFVSEDSEDEDDPEEMDATTGGDVELHDEDDTDPEDDEEMLEEDEDEDEGEEDGSESDEESLSDHPEDQQEHLDDDIWQELDVPRDDGGILLEPDDDDDNDDEDNEHDGVEVIDTRLDDTLEDLAYALEGGGLGDAPVFVQPPGQVAVELDMGSQRLFDLGILGETRLAQELPPLDAVIPFDPVPDEFGRAGHRRAFRTPHIIRTSMLHEMLGGPTAQMIQDLARNQHGDIHLALSGPAAQLLFQEAGLDSSQFRHRMMSRYATRTGRPSSREGGLSPSMTTAQRWAEEIRVNAGPAFENRLSEMENHVIRRLLPAAREAARLQAEEVARQQKEAEEKAKAEREAQEKAEAEEKARLEAEAALAEQQRQETESKPPEPEENATMVEQESIPSASNQDTAGSEPLPSTGDPTTAEASSSQRPRVTVMYQGESVDITDADIDPEFLNAVPEEIRDEIIGNFVREQRQTRPPRASEAEMDMEFLNALPAELREDVLRGQSYARMAEAVDMDAASVLATLPEELRQTVLLEQLDQDHTFLETMPSSILAEANALRAQRDSRRPLPGISVVNQTIPPPATRKIQYRETAQLLDKSGLVHLVRLLFFLDQNRRASLQQVLVNLSENNRSRIDLLSILLTLLNSNKIDLNAVDRSFSQLSVRGVKSNSKGKQRDDSITTGTLGDKPPEEHVVIQRTLDTLSAVVQANESASMFFLTEQDHAQGLQRSASKKGKGKERPVTGPHYPFVQLLSLLERPNLVQQAHSLDAISGLLCTITKPLAVLREPPRSDDHSPKTIVPTIQDPSRPHATTEATSSPTRAEGEVNTLQTPNEPVQPSEEVKPAEPSPPTREDILRSKPPQFPEHSLRLVVNLLTMGECSSRCFQNTQTLVFNLSSLPYARDVITQELKTKAEEFGHIIQNELDVLLRAVHHLKKGEELPSGITTKFSLPTSNQAKLLRILKILENVYSPTLPGRTIPTTENTESDEKLQALYDQLNFSPLWKKLSDCLKAVEDRSDATHIATFLLPLMESLMVVCKSSTAKTPSVAHLLARASASPRSPLLDREASGDVFVTFTDKHRKVLNLMVRNKPSLMNGSFSLLVQNPRVLDFDNKRNYFVQKLRHRSRSDRERESYPTIAINVRRAKVFEDSFQSISRLKDRDLKYGKLNIRFSGEEGVDAGGVTREWFRILAREIFNPNYALFAPCGADRLTYQPNPASWINPDHLRYFKFVGRILGKAIYDQRLLDGHFARSVYRQLLGKPVNYRDLEWSDPPYYNGLRWMLDNSVEAMDLTFSEQNDQLGQMVVVDLKPNGRNIPVTDENKDEYIQLIAEYRLTTSIREQLQAFLEGFYEIVPKEHIMVFDEKELELLISGTPDIDVEDWRSATEYHGYQASDAVIVWWWRALKSFSRSDRAKVLSFATGTAKVPLGGFGELQGVDGVQRFSIHKDYGPMDRLPQAHTCFNQIDLPQYSTYEKLRQQLLLAINEGAEGFGFA